MATTAPVTNPAASAPSGAVAAASAAQQPASAPLIQAYDPTNAQPYQAPVLPSVDQASPTAADALPPNQDISQFGAASPAAGAAAIGNQFLRGIMQGVAVSKVDQAIKLHRTNQAMQQNLEAASKDLYDLAKTGADSNSPEYKAAQDRVMAAWKPMMDFYGEHVPGVKIDKKTGQPVPQKKSILDRLKGNDPAEVSAALYEGMLKAGPPVLHQVAQFQTPQYRQYLAGQGELAESATQAKLATNQRIIQGDNQQDWTLTRAVNKDNVPLEINSKTGETRPVSEAKIIPKLTGNNVPLGADRVARYNASLVDRWHVLNKGPLPQEYLLPPTATEQDYKDVDSMLSQTENAQGTKAQRDTANQMRREVENQTKGTWMPYTAGYDNNGNPITRFINSKDPSQTKDAPLDYVPKQVATAQTSDMKGLQGSVNFANNYLNHFKNGQRPANVAIGDQALIDQFFNVVKPGTGFRMTQPQRAGLQQARSLAEGLRARYQRGMTGAAFSDDQRAQIVQTMNEVVDSKKKGMMGAPATAKSAEAFNINDYPVVKP